MAGFIVKRKLQGVLPNGIADIQAGGLDDASLGTSKFQNLSITNAKINDLSASKITAGNITATIGITTGTLTAASAAIILDSSGITIKGKKLLLYDTGVSAIVGEIGSDTSVIYLLAKAGYDISVSGSGGNRVYLGSDGSVEVLSGNSKDIDINPANNIVDFHATKLTNVVDPTSAQDAATKLYVDSKLDDISVSAPTRALGTVYRNTSGKIMVVTVTLQCLNTETITSLVKSDSASTPTVVRAAVQIQNVSGTTILPVTFLVQPSDYYSVSHNGDETKYAWHEWLLL